ncbi:MAG: hypothetical protein OEO77_15885 [Acidimicrobiia bacterium]|nr:hypothetical protein [Acidimicrobiia bacterium]
MGIRRGAACAMLVVLCGACTSVESRPSTAGPPSPTSALAGVDGAGTPLDEGTLGARAAHTATRLLSGAVLVTGGCVTDGCGSATAETFLVSADGASYREGPLMSTPRDSHSASITSGGLVVLAGGFAGEGQAPLSSVEVFDPSSGVMTEVVSLRLGRGGHAAATAGDGRVLFVGGWIGPRTYTATTEIFDPVDGTIAEGPELPVAADALDAITLRDGRILVTGGQVRPGVATAVSAIFDPATGSWAESGELLTPRFKHTSVLLSDGSVLVMGGTSDDRVLLATTEIFDPSSGEFRRGPDLEEPRYKMQGGAAVLEDGRVAIAGGGRTVEILDIGAGVSQVVASFTARGSFTTISLLGSGDLLVVGGYGDDIRLRDEARLIRTGAF